MLTRGFALLGGICVLYLILWFMTPLPTIFYKGDDPARPSLRPNPIINDYHYSGEYKEENATREEEDTYHLVESDSQLPKNPQSNNNHNNHITITEPDPEEPETKPEPEESETKPEPEPEKPETQTSTIPKASNLPIGIITHRPPLLTRLFEYMLKLHDKIDTKDVYVLEDGTTDETGNIISKYGATRVVCENQIRGLEGLNANYRCLMKYMYENTKADSFIFLEEDLMLAPDFYSFFLQLAPVMQVDPNVFCISTWSDNGFELYARDPSVVIRQGHFGGYGWAITRKLYQEEIAPVQWGSSSYRMWDQYMQDLTRDRVCLAPEIARTHHASGNTGATIDQLAQTSSFDNIRLNDVAEVDLRPDQLTYEAYDKLLMGMIEEGTFVGCKGGLLDYENSILLVYFHSSGSNDDVWNRITSWFGIWGLGNGGAQRGITRGLITFKYATNRVFLIGSASPFVQKMPHKFASEQTVYVDHAERGGLAFGNDNCRKQPHPVPHFEIVTGEQKESCTMACSRKNKKCEIEYLPHLNYCDALKEYGGCQSCQPVSPHHPSFSFPSIHKDGTSSIGIHSHHEKWLNCDGVPDHDYRLCPCV